MKIYDCFTFYNEFDILELRFRELYDHVDHFVLVEGNRTFQNQEKPFYYDSMKYRYTQWQDKIIRVRLMDMPEDTDTWGRERHQRDGILQGLPANTEDKDIVMIGDVDEIPRIETIQKLRAGTQSIWGFRMPLFNFKFNYMMCTQDYYSVWSGAIRRGLLNSPEEFRRMRHILNQCPYNFSDDNVQIIEHAGWHFTYLGSKDFAVTKIQSFSHDETNCPEILDNLDLEESIRQGVGINRTHIEYRFTPVALDDYFPETVTNNIEKYKDKIIIDIPAASARQYLPAML